MLSLEKKECRPFVIILYADRIMGRVRPKCEICLFYLGQRHIFDLTIIVEEKQMTFFLSTIFFSLSLRQSESTGSFSAPMNTL